MIKNIERTKDGVDSIIDRTHDVVVAAADRVESMADRVAGRTRVAGESVRNGAAAASRVAHLRVEGAAEAVDRNYTRAAGSLSRATTATTDYIAENPGRALLLAASAGFVIGLFVHRRRLAA